MWILIIGAAALGFVKLAFRDVQTKKEDTIPQKRKRVRKTQKK